MLLVVPGVKRKAQVNTSDVSEPPEKCQAFDGETVPLTLPGTSQDGNGPLPAVPGTSQDGGALPMPEHSARWECSAVCHARFRHHCAPKF